MANKTFDEQVEAFNEFHSQAQNPESSSYDPYFRCRYVMDFEKRQIRKADYLEESECIRQIQQDKYEIELDEILTECYGMNYKEYIELPVSQRPLISLCKGSNENKTNNFPDNPSNNNGNSNENAKSNEVEQHAEFQQQQTEHKAVEERKKAIQRIETAKINNYAFDETTLSDNQKSILDDVVLILNKYSDVIVLIIGHTCEIGGENINFKKGLKRAEIGKEYLVRKGISADRISVDSKGETQPLVTNTSSDNRKQNRRIEFVIE
ncbi:MAG: OmpA family protein [Bacteroidales bacterium]|nr:OmpA family protein [Bacteroidales bacterium]